MTKEVLEQNFYEILQSESSGLVENLFLKLSLVLVSLTSDF